jgi:hypothetical protein
MRAGLHDGENAMFTVIQHFRSTEWTGKIEETFVDENEARAAYEDAAWAYAHAPSGPAKVELRAPDGAVVRAWPL